MSHLSPEIRERVRAQAKNRCGYCLSPQRLILGWLEIEHIQPKGNEGTDEEENLWLACRLCNNFKKTQTEGRDPESGLMVPLFNPRKQQWSEHFSWSEDGTHILGKTPIGRVTVLALHLNNPIAVTVRQAWIAGGWSPPEWGQPLS